MIIALTATTVMFLWALCYPFISTGLEYSPPLMFAFLRAIIAGLTLLIFARVIGRPPIRGVGNWLYMFAIALTATTIGFWGMFYAGGILSPGLATVLTNTQPIIAGVLGSYILKEKLNGKSQFGLAIGFFGIILISLSSITLQNEGLMKGVAYVLFASAGIAASNVILKHVATKVDILYAMGWQLLFGSLPLGLMSLYQEDIAELRLTPEFLVSLIVLSILGTSLAFVLWFWLLERAPLYQVNAYSFLTPILGLAIGFFYYSEVFSILQVLGVFGVIAGIWFVNTNAERRQLV